MTLKFHLYVTYVTTSPRVLNAAQNLGNYDKFMKYIDFLSKGGVIYPRPSRLLCQ